MAEPTDLRRGALGTELLSPHQLLSCPHPTWLRAVFLDAGEEELGKTPCHWHAGYRGWHRVLMCALSRRRGAPLLLSSHTGREKGGLCCETALPPAKC